ncbi:MAG TPA: dTDP-4-dehydrorhamnose reductase [Acidobacteriaceae bacterium]|nr:dTDP-4-dehydrorhamnose reductase [Acidobacteriaceae bacterium]
MQKTKILVFGRIGQVGWELRHKLACLGQVTSLEYPEIDFSKPDSIRAAIRSTQPAVVINAAAYTAVDKAESEPELAMAINGTAPGVIAEEAKRFGSLMLHYSTDYVFDGTKHGAYVESDAPNPVNVYGRSKLTGDEAIQAVGGNFLILRTSWVYGSRGSNFLLTMLRLARERTELRIVDDQIGAPTSSECIAQATADLLAQMLTPAGGGLDGRSGTYNLTSTGETSWFEFARKLFTQSAATFGITIPSLVPISTSDYPRPAKRPANSRLSCQLLAETFGVMMPAWEDALSLVLETLAEGISPDKTH